MQSQILNAWDDATKTRPTLQVVRPVPDTSPRNAVAKLRAMSHVVHGDYGSRPHEREFDRPATKGPEQGRDAPTTVTIRSHPSREDRRLSLANADLSRAILIHLRMA